MNSTLMNPVRIFYLFAIVLFLGLYGHGQQGMAVFLDSLNKQLPTYFESKIGNSQKAAALLKQIDTTKKSTEQIDLILEYSTFKQEQTQGDANPYLLWARTVSKILKDKQREAEILVALGTSVHVRQPSKSIFYYKEALLMYENNQNTEGIIHLNRRIGLWHYGQKRYDKALAFFFNNVDIARKTNNEAQLVVSYHNIGDSFMQVFDDENAIKYLKLSSQMETKHPHGAVRVMNLCFLGKIYLDRNELTLSQTYLKKGNRAIASTGEMPYLLVDNTMNLGIIAEKNGNLPQAYTNYREAFAQVYPMDFSKRITLLLSVRMAQVLLIKKEYGEAVTLLKDVFERKFDENLKGARSLSHEDIIDFYATLGVAYQAIGDTEKAMFFKNKQIETWQQSNALTLLMNSKKIENDYSLAIADQKIENLNNEKKLQNSRYVIGIISMVSLSVILLLSSLYFKQRTKSLRKQQELGKLALQNEIITSSALRKENQIKSLEFELERKAIKDDLRNKISTDLHDEVGTLLTGLAMQSELLESRSPKESKAKLHQISALSRTAMLGMRDAVWAMDAQKDFSESLVDRMNEFAHEQLEHTGISFDIQTFGMDKNTPLSGNIRHHFNLIFKEALTNMLKHAKASAICVQLRLTEKTVSLDIRDNGKSTGKATATSGLGLANMRKRAKSLNGKISFCQTKGFGILVEIPV